MAKPSLPDRKTGTPLNWDEPLNPLCTEAQVEALRAWLAALEERSLEEQWRRGDTTAISRAVHELIVEYHRRIVAEHLPDQPDEWWWLLDAVTQLVDQRMPDDEKRTRREFDLHQRRWEMVVELRERRYELLERGDDRGMSLENCFVAVAECEEAEGGEVAVKRSYYLIEAAGGERATLESYKLCARPRHHRI